MATKISFSEYFTDTETVGSTMTVSVNEKTNETIFSLSDTACNFIIFTLSEYQVSMLIPMLTHALKKQEESDKEKTKTSYEEGD